MLKVRTLQGFQYASLPASDEGTALALRPVD